MAFSSTGNELRSIGEPLDEGCVYDSNLYTLRYMLQRLGFEVLNMGVVRDDEAALEAAFAAAWATCCSGRSPMRPGRPITYHIIKTVNTFELVAQCCKGEMIGTNIIKRTFGDQFVTHYEDIQRCQRIPGLLQDGNTLLKQSKAASDFYKTLIKERISHRRTA